MAHQQVIYVYLHKHNQIVALICHIQKIYALNHQYYSCWHNIYNLAIGQIYI